MDFEGFYEEVTLHLPLVLSREEARQVLALSACRRRERWVVLYLAGTLQLVYAR